VHSEYEEQIKAHREKVVEPVLQLNVFKKAKEVLSDKRTRLVSEGDDGAQFHISLGSVLGRQKVNPRKEWEYV
jgi:hypothetical protein